MLALAALFALLLFPLGIAVGSGNELPVLLQKAISAPVLRGTRLGLVVLDGETEEVLFEHSSKEAFLPASNQKLFVTSMALERWGIEYRFEVRLYRLGRSSGGSLWGDLYVAGVCYPGFSSSAVYDLAAALKRKGVEIVEGDFVVDDFAFQGGGGLWMCSDNPISLNLGPVLAEVGIEVKGERRQALLPAGVHLIHAEKSVALAELLYEQNKASDNRLADRLFLLLGREGERGQMSFSASREAMMRYLYKIGVRSTTVVDGSGISRGNRTTPRDLARLLFRALRGPYSAEFLSSLPIGGRDGTLRGRFRGFPIEGRVRAKTGHISGVSALSGYLFRRDGRTLVFSLLVNGVGNGSRTVDRGLNGIVSVLDRLPLPRPPDQRAVEPGFAAPPGGGLH